MTSREDKVRIIQELSQTLGVGVEELPQVIRGLSAPVATLAFTLSSSGNIVALSWPEGLDKTATNCLVFSKAAMQVAQILQSKALEVSNVCQTKGVD